MVGELEGRVVFSDYRWEKVAELSNTTGFHRLIGMDHWLDEDLANLDKQMGKRFPVDRYLLKAIAISKYAHQVLPHAANSPRLLPWFRSTLGIEGLVPFGPFRFLLAKLLTKSRVKLWPSALEYNH